MKTIWTFPEAERRPPPILCEGGAPGWDMVHAGARVRPGWYRLLAVLDRHDQSVHLILRFSIPGGSSRSLSLPVGLNGEIDHFVCFPFSPEAVSLVVGGGPAPSGEVAIDAHRVAAPVAMAFMAGRVFHHLCQEGTLNELRSLKKVFGVDEVVLRSSRSWLETAYALAKLRMVRRSLPLEEYPRWLQCRESFFRAETGRLAFAASRQAFSVLVVCPNGDDSGLKRSLASLGEQRMLPAACMVVGGEVLEGGVEDVARCPVCRFSGDEPESLLRAVEEVATDWVCLLEAGDELLSGALIHLLAKAGESSDIICVYGDEERVVQAGQPMSPVFKPDFDAMLQDEVDYVGSGCLLRTALVVDAVKGCASLSDMRRAVLRVVGVVAHVPHILLRRSFSPSAAETVRTDCLPGDAVKSPLVSIIIPTREGRDMLETCISSIQSITRYRNYEILVVDNGSLESATLEYLSSLETSGVARVIRADIPFNYSRLNNLAVRHAQGTLLAFLNNDIEVVAPEWLEEMSSLAMQDGVGTVGAMLLYQNGRIQHAGVAVGIGVAGHPWKGADPDDHRWSLFFNYRRRVTANTGACLVLRRDLFDDLGGFDEGLAVSFNDVDLCLRAQAAGYRNVWTPRAVLVHHESVTRGRLDTLEKKAGFRQEKQMMLSRWGAELERDPWYNPNLSHETEDGGLALFLTPSR